jgi:hypothetical protein
MGGTSREEKGCNKMSGSPKDKLHLLPTFVVGWLSKIISNNRLCKVL